MCMLILSPASATDPAHQGDDPAGGGGCTNDRDCDGILNDDDLCPDYADHALASEVGVCDALPNKGKKAHALYNWAYGTCSLLLEHKNQASAGSDTFGWLGIGFAWVPILGITGGLSALYLSGKANRFQEMYDNARCGHADR